jgi:hypothetical protein
MWSGRAGTIRCYLSGQPGGGGTAPPPEVVSESRRRRTASPRASSRLRSRYAILRARRNTTDADEERCDTPEELSRIVAQYQLEHPDDPNLRRISGSAVARYARAPSGAADPPRTDPVTE